MRERKKEREERKREREIEREREREREKYIFSCLYTRIANRYTCLTVYQSPIHLRE